MPNLRHFKQQNLFLNSSLLNYFQVTIGMPLKPQTVSGIHTELFFQNQFVDNKYHIYIAV